MAIRMSRSLTSLETMSKQFGAVVLQLCLASALPVSAQRVRPKKAEKSLNSYARQSVKVIPVEIPITNQIYIQARLNNSEPMWFILDTGATSTILDVDKAKELDIKSEDHRSLNLGQTNTIAATFAKNASLDISGIKIPIETLGVMPVRFRHAPQIVGLIGSDFFKRFVVEIDYQARTISLFEPNSFRYTGRGEIVPFELRQEIPHIVVKVSKGNADSLDAWLAVDTGASQTVVVNAAFVEKNKLLETTEGTIKLRAGGLGGGGFNYKVRAKAVKIGNIVFDKPLINFSTGRFAAVEQDGVIGNGFLNRFKLITDYSRKRVILEPSERIKDPTDFDFFLFKIVRSDTTYKIADMLQSSMTAEAGLRIGDILLAVNGQPVSDLSPPQIYQMFMMDGRDRVLSLKRGTETLDIKLQTFPIF